MRQSKKEADRYGSSSERFYTINRLISSSLMKQQLNDRALTYSRNEFEPRTQRESSPGRRRDTSDPIDQLSENMYYSAPRKTRRTRIFEQLPTQIQHLELGAELSNLNFEELDRSILPRIFYSQRCGCQNLLRPCQRLTKLLTEQSIQTMRGQYQRLKNKDPHSMSYLIIRNLIQALPPDYPEAFASIIENLLQLVEVDDLLFPMLYSVVWHSKAQYLAYFVYRQMSKLAYQQQSILPQVQHYINHYSKDLATLLKEQCRHPLEQLCKEFIESGGTSLIPINEYGKYIENLNKTGRLYPARLLFCLLLSCKKEIQTGGPTIGKFLQRNTERLRLDLPWGLIFEAAQHPYLK